MMQYYPNGTAATLRLTHLLRRDTAPAFSQRLSVRLVRSAAQLPGGGFTGWLLDARPGRPTALSLFGSETVSAADLAWIAEPTAATRGAFRPRELAPSLRLFELLLPEERDGRAAPLGFCPAGEDGSARPLWPTTFSTQFPELLSALRTQGAVLRFTAGSAGESEQRACRARLQQESTISPRDLEQYLGTPIRVQMLLLTAAPPSLRLRTVLQAALPGLRMREVSADRTEALWRAPLADAPTLPALAAAILALEPVAGAEPLSAFPQREAPVKPIPATHRNPTARHAIRIGRAHSTADTLRSVSLGDRDLCRHWQIVGQTGTGKSSLLANTIRSAIETGHGLTFFDPHGTTIDLVLRTLPPRYAGRVRVVRIGDAAHPVPMNLWAGGTADEIERTVSDLYALFAEIFDPNHEGIAGPRWERWFTTFAKASIVLLGDRASFQSIVTLSQNQSTMRLLCDAIRLRDSDLAETIRSEYASSESREFADMVNWCVCKFQRLLSVRQLRETLGAGANALDFAGTIDTDTVTLIDLAAPQIGTPAARVIGTLLLMQLWRAAAQRQERRRTHLVFLDEAHLFQTSPLPQMLAESRKFGVGLILAHQHCGQLSREVRDALDANSANFSAFRLSPRDARDAALRLDDERMLSSLCRLDAFRAVTTLSVDGRQTPPFTLRFSRPRPRPDGEEIAGEILHRSIAQLCEPYRGCRALTQREILDILRQAAQARRPKRVHGPSLPRAEQTAEDEEDLYDAVI
jgi:hypothetical protein